MTSLQFLFCFNDGNTLLYLSVCLFFVCLFDFKGYLQSEKQHLFIVPLFCLAFCLVHVLTVFTRGLSIAGSSGEAQIINPDVPFSIEDLTSDHIFYVQNVHQANVHQDVFSFYISDGSSQTEAFDVTIDIQVVYIFSSRFSDVQWTVTLDESHCREFISELCR